ncbi:carboxypeptidase S1 [Microdochium trichocladiopsis]|uniref:Carboxypeptidase S1 n=1 Tax=Microdochium trichocladiopsis TaxID=1682393 RepID=A0A9P8XW75_9PEZI|nr:carboxypeptidase S1 [Microdochium trichocladiopsis]KAH7018139.1 carboxypeptidase S1 [Microdochium trichocladiopsis]
MASSSPLWNRSRVALLPLLLPLLSPFATAQFPPPREGITLLRSKFHENVTISFKEPQICETTPGVKSYSGYVHLPPRTLDDGAGGETQDYPINTFFWFFEARKDPSNAPLSIWLNGGPGGSSMMGLLEELGPCFVGPDSKTTVHNPWAWNNEVNMLFLDQPVQVGFSYDVPTNFSFRYPTADEDESWDDAAPIYTELPKDLPDSELPEHDLNRAKGLGTFSSQNAAHTANSTTHAAHALWHFVQTWFFEFPHYKPTDNGISLWAESYGGHYGPGFMSFFQKQNDKIKSGKGTEKDAHYLRLDTLGIVNGAIDTVRQVESYISFPHRNTYGIQLFNETLYEALMADWVAPGGCKEKVAACSDALRDSDPIMASLGIVTEAAASVAAKKNISEICDAEAMLCAIKPWMTYKAGLPADQSRGWYDIAHPHFDPFPAPTMQGYLKEESVLRALGVPVNFTSGSATVAHDFESTSDLIHGGFLEGIAYLLDSGVKVHMMYGDRDYACNWVGGEMASLAVPYTRQKDFVEAGYTRFYVDDVLDEPGHGWAGMTRQVGNFSFTRVFQAGHEVPSYQPAAAHEIFRRAIFGLDIASGQSKTTDEYKTEGPKDTWDVVNLPPPWPKQRCYVLKPESCNPDIWTKVLRGEATIENYYVVDDFDDEEMGEL